MSQYYPVNIRRISPGYRRMSTFYRIPDSAIRIRHIPIKLQYIHTHLLGLIYKMYNLLILHMKSSLYNHDVMSTTWKQSETELRQYLRNNDSAFASIMSKSIFIDKLRHKIYIIS